MIGIYVLKYMSLIHEEKSECWMVMSINEPREPATSYKLAKWNLGLAI